MSSHRSLALFALTAALASPHAASAAGISNHVEVSNRAAFWFDKADAPEYKVWLEKFPEALQGGASYPDWGYAMPGFGDAGEEAHWDPFLQACADYIHRTYPQPWDRETWRTVAFLFAVTAHSVADISWHGLGVEEGFIDVMAAQDYHGDWNAAHTGADTGGDMVTAYELDQSYMTAPWYIPVDDMVEVYHELGYEEVNGPVMTAAGLLLFIGGHAEKVAGQLLYPYFGRQSPVLVEHMQDAFVGGVDDMSIMTAWKFLDMIDWMENGAPGATRTLDESFDHHGEHESAIDLGLELIEAGLMKVQVEKTERGVLFQLERPIPPWAGRSAPVKRTVREAYADKLIASASSQSTRPSAAVPADAQARRSAPAQARRPVSATSRARSAALAFTPAATYTLDAPYAHLGTALASGDFNGDGRDDLVIGAPGYGIAGQPARGRVSLLFGGKALTGQTLELGAGADQTLASSDDYSRFGWSLAVVDLNADGRDDLAVAAPTTGARAIQYYGQVAVFYGRSTGLAASPDLVIRASAKYTNLGYHLKGGDVNGDGFTDLLIGTPFARSGGRQRGLAAVYLAGPGLASGGDLGLEAADWQVAGEQDWDWFGWHLETVEISGRGRFLLVGAPSVNVGELQSVGRLYGFDMAGIDAGQASLTPAFTLTGDEEFDQLGAAFAVGDPFGAGRPQLALSAPTRESGRDVQAGAVALLRFDGLEGDLTLSDLVPVTTLYGSHAFGHFGWQVALEDLDQDGIDELFIAAPWQKGDAGVEAGPTYVWQGGDLPTGTIHQGESRADAVIDGGPLAGRAGCALAFPDLDGDGIRETVISSRLASTVAPLAGTVAVYSSGSPVLRAKAGRRSR